MSSDIFNPYKHVLKFYLENKRPSLLAYILKQVYAGIFESSNNKDLFWKYQTYFCQIFEITLILFS